MGQQFSFETKLTDLSTSLNPKKDSHVQRQSEKKKKIILEANDSETSKEADRLQIKQRHNKQCEDAELIDQCILKNFFMNSLERQARLEIIKEMSLAYVPEGTVIFEEGEYGNFFYIIKSGQVSCIYNNTQQNIITKGESFGELALLHGAPRTVTCKALTECYLWVMKRRNFKKIIEHISKINFEENKTFIQSIPVLSKIDNYLQGLLGSSLIKETYEPGSMIFKEGSIPTCISIIKAGEINIIQKGTLIRTLKKGDNFGERSILVGSERTCDVVAKTKCVCYSIPISILKNIMGENFQTSLYLCFIKNTFSCSTFFKKFNSFVIDKIFSLFEATNLTKDQVAFKKGYKKGSNIVVVIDGNLVNSQNNAIVAERGTILFEKELYNNSQETIDYDIMPSPDCLFIKAKTQDILKVIGKSSLIQSMEESDIYDSLSKVSIFKNISAKKMDLICHKTNVTIVKDGNTIIKEGECGDKLYIVKSGKVDIFVKGKYIRTLSDKEYLGERALFYNEPRSATAIAKGDVELLFLVQEDFKAIIEGNMIKHLMNRLYMQDSSLTLDDFEFICFLGAGNYGNVSLVKAKKNNFEYAIKAISKQQINHELLHQNLELERSILLQIDHPFIVKLVKTMSDRRFLYFLMEVVKGKELFDVIRDIGLLNKQQTQFYGGSILCAIEYLHERKFVYRDIKPENIMVLYSNGYIKIIDFGTAKKIEDFTSTIIGTPHYMAPEVILGAGYTFNVDFWSTAICMYEFLCGGVPFGENAEDPMEVYSAIVRSKLSFPNYCKDKEFKQLMIHMLTKNPSNRLAKINQIKNHVWFSDFNWDELINMNMTAPYIPVQSGINPEDVKTPYKGMNFRLYAEKYLKDWTPTDGSEINTYPPEKMKEFDDIYKLF